MKTKNKKVTIYTEKKRNWKGIKIFYPKNLLKRKMILMEDMR